MRKKKQVEIVMFYRCFIATYYLLFDIVAALWNKVNNNLSIFLTNRTEFDSNLVNISCYGIFLKNTLV